MNHITKMVVAAVGAAVFTAAPAIASADRVFFLVGTRHVYRIGGDMYAHAGERKQIEQDYADQVAGDEDTYNKALKDGADPAVEGPQLNQALTDLANDRDARLAAIYENVDFERIRHPELQIEGEGPYQVMAINFHRLGDFEIYDSFSVFAPWPGYYVADRPYGWSYGVVYTPTVFVNVYMGWHRTYIAQGRPAFYGFVGHAGPIRVVTLGRSPGGAFIHRDVPGYRQTFRDDHRRVGNLPAGGVVRDNSRRPADGGHPAAPSRYSHSSRTAPPGHGRDQEPRKKDH